MRNFSATVLVASILLNGCATPKPESPEYKNVPGPSQGKATLPRPPAVESGATPAAPTTTAENRKSATTKTNAPIVTPDSSLRGKVSRYNEAGRFVVLEFPVAHMPTLGQTLFVYRNGLKVGEVKVTGPQRDDRSVADLSAGEAQPGDDIREQ